jgi:hypothetical protein
MWSWLCGAASARIAICASMLDAKLTQPIPGTIIIKIGTNVGVSGSAGNGHWDDLVAISALWTNPWQAGIKHG